MDDLITRYAMQFVGSWYKWGGDDPMGWDCSGLVQELLESMGKAPPDDLTAQGLYDYFSDTDRGWINHAEPGSLVFYGKSPRQVTHVAMLIGNDAIIEAGGGGRTTKTEADAAAANAYVRVRKVNARPDLIAVIFPY